MRSFAPNDLRRAMANTVLARLDLFTDISVSLITPSLIGGEESHRFHYMARRHAERSATGDIYCFMDDDVLPLNKDYFEAGESALRNHPQFGTLQGRLLIEHYTFPANPEVFELHAIGTPMFIRKGILEFPEGTQGEYDAVLQNIVNGKGLKTGIANRCLTNHIGYGFSTMSAAHWMA